jgi:hypothetical protein
MYFGLDFRCLLDIFDYSGFCVVWLSSGLRTYFCCVWLVIQVSLSQQVNPNDPTVFRSTLLWTLSSNQGNSWKYASVPFTAPTAMYRV